MQASVIFFRDRSWYTFWVFKFTTKYKLTKITDINSEIKGKNDNEIKQISINKLMTTIEVNIFQLLLKKRKKRF